MDVINIVLIIKYTKDSITFPVFKRICLQFYRGGFFLLQFLSYFELRLK